MNKKPKNIAIIGSSGAIGSALVESLSTCYPKAQMTAFSRHGKNPILYHCEDSIANAAQTASKTQPLDLVIVATGLLHDGPLMPEKSLKELSADKFHTIFEANTITPALIAKHFIPKLDHQKRACFAVLSARVGSISDNRLGGWYAYRASKAALNMIIKNIAIEVSRTSKETIIIGLHPGTVDSPLSKPFQSHLPTGQLFTPLDCAHKLIDVIRQRSPEDSGKCFAWDGSEVCS
jgi:NAD(P)-dependent dehydrogenase (short-subunit alcohol dehydrogenase family)